ncbi:hypothetical protein NG831_12530 [Xanthomonas sacchari]|uniref:hypothetical protein n=1 Tax=Xanthomonas sacchari TaxID=56458 RepID=UPI0022503EE6|nr:hypothetical protein [Xanthomonas sacchari]UYK65069.1 hypothetical protein NG831_12530 [Xanthomonas sacchari]
MTKSAFDTLRSYIQTPKEPPQELIANQGQVKQMLPSDGLLLWTDGPVTTKQKAPEKPLLTQAQVKLAHLWVVRKEDVVHAQEHCAFGKELESGLIKHTNLTGGDPAFSGGELVFIDNSTIVINGNSGRYGPKGSEEMKRVAHAFAKSGYRVWSMGFDTETNRPVPFIGASPEWISA